MDSARARGYQKRGGGVPKVTLDEALMRAERKRLRSGGVGRRGQGPCRGLTSARARSWSLRFFGGLSVEETAAVLKVSPDTVLRDWGLAKAWLKREMSAGNWCSGSEKKETRQ